MSLSIPKELANLPKVAVELGQKILQLTPGSETCGAKCEEYAKELLKLNALVDSVADKALKAKLKMDLEPVKKFLAQKESQHKKVLKPPAKPKTPENIFMRMPGAVGIVTNALEHVRRDDDGFVKEGEKDEIAGMCATWERKLLDLRGLLGPSSKYNDDEQDDYAEANAKINDAIKAVKEFSDLHQEKAARIKRIDIEIEFLGIEFGNLKPNSRNYVEYFNEINDRLHVLQLAISEMSDRVIEHFQPIFQTSFEAMQKGAFDAVSSTLNQIQELDPKKSNFVQTLTIIRRQLEQFRILEICDEAAKAQLEEMIEGGLEAIPQRISEAIHLIFEEIRDLDPNQDTYIHSLHKITHRLNTLRNLGLDDKSKAQIDVLLKNLQMKFPEDFTKISGEINAIVVASFKLIVFVKDESGEEVPQFRPEIAQPVKKLEEKLKKILKEIEKLENQEAKAILTGHYNAALNTLKTMRSPEAIAAPTKEKQKEVATKAPRKTREAPTELKVEAEPAVSISPAVLSPRVGKKALEDLSKIRGLLLEARGKVHAKFKTLQKNKPEVAEALAQKVQEKRGKANKKIKDFGIRYLKGDPKLNFSEGKLVEILNEMAESADGDTKDSLKDMRRSITSRMETVSNVYQDLRRHDKGIADELGQGIGEQAERSMDFGKRMLKGEERANLGFILTAIDNLLEEYAF